MRAGFGRNRKRAPRRPFSFAQVLAGWSKSVGPEGPPTKVFEGYDGPEGSPTTAVASHEYFCGRAFRPDAFVSGSDAAQRGASRVSPSFNISRVAAAR
ncbi:DUF6053 domain-containing protein [Lysobacter sp. CA199]|uniref:DUF6053 domain-containing protein n=1 Tax=Lysobacter sp. CA199 TaxID=3455608 RepID=UPI003F8D0D9D